VVAGQLGVAVAAGVGRAQASAAALRVHATDNCREYGPRRHGCISQRRKSKKILSRRPPASTTRQRLLVL
jgi:hypothetical protein